MLTLYSDKDIVFHLCFQCDALFQSQEHLIRQLKSDDVTNLWWNGGKLAIFCLSTMYELGVNLKGFYQRTH